MQGSLLWRGFSEGCFIVGLCYFLVAVVYALGALGVAVVRGASWLLARACSRLVGARLMLGREVDRDGFRFAMDARGASRVKLWGFTAGWSFLGVVTFQKGE